MNPKQSYLKNKNIFGNTNTGIIGKINSFTNNLSNVKPQTNTIKTPTNMSVDTKPNMSMDIKTPNTVKNTPVKTSSVGATTPSTIKSPAAQTYIQNMAQNTNPNVLGTSTTTTPEKPITYNVTPQQEAKKTFIDTYKEYLQSQFNPEKLKTAQSNIEELSKRQGEEILRSRKEQEDIQKNPTGMLESGLTYNLNKAIRESNKSLADIALAKGYAIDVYNSMIQSGKSAIEAEQEAINAVSDASKPIEVGNIIYQKDENGKYQPVSKSQSGTTDLPSLVKEYEYAKNQGYTGDFTQYQNEKSTGTLGQKSLSTDGTKMLENLNFVESTIKQAKDLAKASGRSGIRKTVEGLTVGDTDYTNLVALTNTLRTNILTLATDPTIKKFFGPQMSNADVQLMTSAGTTLNPELQSPENLKSELVRLENLITRMKNSVPQGTTSGSNSVFAEDWTQ